MRSSNPGSPSFNRTPPPEFKCVAESAAMRKLRDDIASCAKQKRAIPLFVGPNTLETMSFVRHEVATCVRPKDRPKGLTVEMLKIVQEEHPLLAAELLDGEASGFVFLKGDAISTSIQLALSLARFRRVDLFLAIVSHNARDLVQMGHWNKMFYRQFSCTFFWPEWNDRKKDHGALLDQMKERLKVTRDLRHPPELDTTAVDFLRNTPWKGVDDAYAALQRGYDTYHADPDAVAMTSEHIAGNALRALSSSGRRVESSAPPAN